MAFAQSRKAVVGVEESFPETFVGPLRVCLVTGKRKVWNTNKSGGKKGGNKSLCSTDFKCDIVSYSKQRITVIASPPKHPLDCEFKIR